MAHHKWEEDSGDELDLDAIEQQAEKVQRRALDLDFDDLVPKGASSLAGGSGRAHGAGSLSDDAFLSPKEREARARARGATPTLDRLGKGAPRRRRPAGVVDSTLRMDTELTLTRRGVPGWVWAALAVVLFLGAAGGVGYWLYGRHQAKLAEEEALLDAARQRAREQDAERLQRLKE